MAVTEKLYKDISGFSVADMDDYIVENWKYFNNSKGISNYPTVKNKYSNSKVNTMHNCIAWAVGRRAIMHGITTATEFAKRIHGNPYELYYSCKKKPSWCKRGVSSTPEVGAMIVWGKASDSKGNSYSHIAMVEKVSGDYIWISEDNYNTIRDYNGTRSRNGVRKIKKNSNLSSSYPFVGYILPDYKFVPYFTMKALYNVNFRKDASTSSVIQNRILKGETCRYYGLQKNVGKQTWYRVKFGDNMGWVCYAENGTKYLERC